MRNRVQIRYSACFKQRVISELESGRFASAEAARVHYGIGGSSTIDKWLRTSNKTLSAAFESRSSHSRGSGRLGASPAAFPSGF